MSVSNLCKMEIAEHSNILAIKVARETKENAVPSGRIVTRQVVKQIKPSSPARAVCHTNYRVVLADPLARSA